MLKSCLCKHFVAVFAEDMAVHLLAALPFIHSCMRFQGLGAKYDHWTSTVEIFF